MLIRDGDLMTGFYILKSGKLSFTGFKDDLQRKNTKKNKRNRNLSKNPTALKLNRGYSDTPIE